MIAALVARKYFKQAELFCKEFITLTFLRKQRIWHLLAANERTRWRFKNFNEMTKNNKKISEKQKIEKN